MFKFTTTNLNVAIASTHHIYTNKHDLYKRQIYKDGGRVIENDLPNTASLLNS